MEARPTAPTHGLIFAEASATAASVIVALIVAAGKQQELRHHGLVLAIDHFTDKPSGSVSAETRAMLLDAEENDEERFA